MPNGGQIAPRVRRWAAPAFLMALALAAVGPAASQAAPRDTEAKVVLEGSNGFRVKITGGAYSGLRTASIRARRGGRSTSYGTLRDVTLTRRTFAARLGPLGSFQLRFQPRSARMVDGDPRCGKGRARVVSGVFRGRVEVSGENDFTSVSASRAPGKLIRSGLGWCRKSRPTDRLRNPDRAVTLSGCRLDDHRTSTSLIAVAERPRGPRSVTWVASRFERSRGVFITRKVSLRAAAASFRFPADGFSTARLTPPPPFAGSATYFSGEGGGTGQLGGDLTAGFAGSGGPVAITPTDEADFGPRRSGLLDCAFGLAPDSRPAAAQAAGPGPAAGDFSRRP